MSKIRVALAVAVLIGLTLAVATAQEAEPEEKTALPLSVERNVLFAHGTGDDEFNGFLNTLEEDGDDPSMGSGQFANSAKTWTFNLEPNLTTGLVLDPEETIDAFVYMGSTSNVGRLTVTTQISSGEDILAKGEAKTINVAASYSLLTWNLEVLNETIHPDTNLTWVVKATGIATGSTMGVGESRKSNLTLPILGEFVPPPPEILESFSNETNGTLNDTLEFPNVTHALHQYNWTMKGEHGATGDLVVEGTGNVSLAATDGNGTQVLNVNAVSAAANASGTNNSTNSTANSTQSGNTTTIPLEAPDGVSGAWIVNLSVANFTGTIRLALGPAVETMDGLEDDNETTPTPTTRSSAAASPAEVSETPEGRGVPGPGLALAAAAVGALAIARRGRRPSA